MTTVVVTPDLAAEGRRDDRDVVMVGGEQGGQVVLHDMFGV